MQDDILMCFPNVTLLTILKTIDIFLCPVKLSRICMCVCVRVRVSFTCRDPLMYTIRGIGRNIF